METISKVTIDKKTRRNSIIKISIVGTVTLVGIALALYSLFNGKYLFSVWYFVAFILGLSYVVIRINAIFPSYVAVADDKLVMSVWENGVLPYRISEKSSFFSDFMPEKVKKDEILLEDIAKVYLGSKRFLERSLKDDEYPEDLKKVIENRHLESAVKRVDFLLIVAKDGETCFMSVTDFDTDGLGVLVDEIEKRSGGAQIFVGIPKLRRKMDLLKKA